MTDPYVCGRPLSDEYAPHYGSYVSLVAQEDVLASLDQQRRDMVLLLSCRSEEEGNFRYAPGKWTAKELIGHICDSERVFAYRALRFARADSTPLAGFEQDDYVHHGPFATCLMPEVIEDFIAVRRATISLFRSLKAADWQRRGVANNGEVSVRALAYIIAGHELHHRRILEGKYFSANQAVALKP